MEGYRIATDNAVGSDDFGQMGGRCIGADWDDFGFEIGSMRFVGVGCNIVVGADYDIQG